MNVRVCSSSITSLSCNTNVKTDKVMMGQAINQHHLYVKTNKHNSERKYAKANRASVSITYSLV